MDDDYLVPRGTLGLNSKSQSLTKGDLHPTCQPGHIVELAKQEKCDE